MNAVTIGAHRCRPVAASNRLPVRALHEFLPDAVMAFGAGRRDVELGDRRFGIAGAQDVVLPVTVGANCGRARTRRHRLAVHAFLVRREGSGTDAGRGHHELLAVACAAGLWNVGARDFRFRVARGQYLVHAAVAILAFRHVGVARRCGLGVDAVIVRSLLISVTGGADRLGRRWLMRERLDVGVAIRATEGAVD